MLVLILILILFFCCWKVKENFSQLDYSIFIPQIFIKPETHIITKQIGSNGFLVSSDQPNVPKPLLDPIKSPLLIINTK
jgi:hypothetical protein